MFKSKREKPRKHIKLKHYRGRVVDIVTLTFNDWFGRIISKTRCSVTDKKRGFLMVDQIERNFNLTESDKIEMRKKLKEKEEEDFKEMEKQAIERKVWERNEKGQLVSPYPKIKIEPLRKWKK